MPEPVLTRGLLFCAGLLLLYLGAQGLVRGASRLARDLGVSALVVGLTVVAFGTSAPELVVSVLAAGAGEAEVAIGNVVGSNIANIALILGLSALVSPLGVDSSLVRREIPLMIVASAALVILMADGSVGRWEAVLLLIGFAGYVAFVYRSARRPAPEPEPDWAALGVGAPVQEEERSGKPGAPSGSGTGGRGRDAGLVLLGLVALVAGAHMLVESSVWFARRLGVSELIVGLTVVAVGTSLPELATSAVAALRRETDIAVGNIVGSNVFNILAILGAAGLVRPLVSDSAILRFELPVMVGAAVLLLPLAWSDFEIERWEGVLLLAGYGVFLWVVVGRAAGLG